MTTRPYGDCYEASLQNAEELNGIRIAYESDPIVNKDLQKLYEGLGGSTGQVEVVHGTIVPPQGLDAGRTITHAWIEVGGKVIETSLNQKIPYSIEDYYELYKASPIKRYSVEEARELAREYGYCPWHEKV